MKTKPAVLITGAGTGIGAATARIFSDNGHDVVLTGRRRHVLEETAEVLPGKTHVIPADLTDLSEIQALIKEATRQVPHLGILVNNAGIYSRGEFLKTGDREWTSMFESNLMSVVRITREIVPHFQKNSAGAIVNVSSTAGLRPLAGLAPYATVKAAVISLTQCLALELAPSQIRVNAVCPGIIETPIHGFEKLDKAAAEKVKKQMSAMHPLGRMGQPEDVAWAIYQLCAEQAGWMTGVILPVDGGISLL
jgi:NAD(P)-dependent dehydrogenase (short-subunit alcohol dehydrogenase family)